MPGTGWLFTKAPGASQDEQIPNAHYQEDGSSGEEGQSLTVRCQVSWRVCSRRQVTLAKGHDSASETNSTKFDLCQSLQLDSDGVGVHRQTDGGIIWKCRDQYVDNNNNTT